MVSDIACHNAPVFIMCATGHRELDATGFGPGACYAAAVLKAFHDEGVQCFSGLMIPTGMNWEIFCAQLAGRFTTCKILLVLQTIALYSSKPCLKEIYAAQKSKIEIIPIRFEKDLPQVDKQWPQIKQTDMDGILMLTEVTKVLQSREVIDETVPKYPKTMLSDPQELDVLVREVKKRLEDPDYFKSRKQRLAAEAQSPRHGQGNPLPAIPTSPYGASDWGHGGGVAEPWLLGNLNVDGADPEQDPLLHDGSGQSGSTPQRAARFRKEKRGQAIEAQGFQMDFTQAANPPPSHHVSADSSLSAVSSASRPRPERKRPKAVAAAGGGSAPASLTRNRTSTSGTAALGKAAGTAISKTQSVPPERKRPKPAPAGGQDF
jgi:hypothetical protein